MLILVAIIVVVVGFLIMTYNRLVVLRNRIENAWSQIDVQLKRRADLIPNLVETVKGYAAHEKEVFQRVTEARSALMHAEGVRDQAEANNMLTGALKSLFAVAENYPELKANQNFMMLQEELSGTESKIAYARQFYNDSVLTYDNMREKFPSNIVANMFGFAEREYFAVEESERGPVSVDFSS
ncbi:MAG: LemA family protein [Candidatus Eisenbacteria bacterium]|nr:LemA family protein [Candidatus Eisenbacteria bacterium]